MTSWARTAYFAALATVFACDVGDAASLEAAVTIDDDVECDTAITGDVTIATEDDVARLARVHTITGALTVRATSLDALALPCLERIGGALVLEANPALASVDLPLLPAIEGGLTVRGNDALRALDLGWLGGWYGIQNNAQLRRVSITGHAPIVYGVSVWNNPRLEKLDLSDTLQVWGSMYVSGASLEQIVAPELRDVGAQLELTGLPALDILGMPHLERIGRELIVRGVGLVTWNGMDALRRVNFVDITGNPRLRDVGLPALERVSYVFVRDNPALRIVGFEALHAASGLDAIVIAGNPLLPACEAIEVLDRVEAYSFEGQSGNDDTGSCE